MGFWKNHFLSSLASRVMMGSDLPTSALVPAAIAMVLESGARCFSWCFPGGHKASAGVIWNGHQQQQETASLGKGEEEKKNSKKATTASINLMTAGRP